MTEIEPEGEQRLRCRGCGRQWYTGAIEVVLARGDRCPDCGGELAPIVPIEHESPPGH
jgi:rRNA maturation endonuclease Nob1